MSLQKHARELIWSKNGRNYAFQSNFSAFGGDGNDVVWVSAFNHTDNPFMIFDLMEWSGEDEEFFMKYAISNLKFIDNETVEFSVFRLGEGDNSELHDETARYRYDLRKEKMKEVFRR